MRQIIWQNVLAPGFSSGTIAYFGAGGLSHCDVLDEDGWLWGARSDHIPDYTRDGSPLLAPGFRPRPPNYARWVKRIQYTLKVSDRAYGRFWGFTQRQLGKPYDPFAILCFAFPFLARHRNWRDPSRWFCSEGQAAAAEHARIVSIDENFHWITPGGWGLILCARGAHVQKMKCEWPPKGVDIRSPAQRTPAAPAPPS